MILMPRLELELSANLPESERLDDILVALVDRFSQLPTVDPAEVRAYANLHLRFAVGHRGRPMFVHLTVNLLDGRDMATRQEISRVCAETLRNLFEESYNTGELKISVSLNEMSRETYSKF